MCIIQDDWRGKKILTVVASQKHAACLSSAGHTAQVLIKLHFTQFGMSWCVRDMLRCLTA